MYSFFFFGNLLRQILEHGLIGLVCLAQQVCIGDKLLQQLVGIGALGRERLLRAGKLSLLLLERPSPPASSSLAERTSVAIWRMFSSIRWSL